MPSWTASCTPRTASPSTARPCENQTKNPPNVASLTPTSPSEPLKPSMGAAVRDHRNAVRDRSESLSAINRNPRPQSPESANGDGAHRWWKVASRAHSIPKLVEITPQVGIKLLDRLTIHTGRTRIGFDRFISLIHLLLGNIERFVCRMSLHLPVSSCFDHTTT